MVKFRLLFLVLLLSANNCFAQLDSCWVYNLDEIDPVHSGYYTQQLAGTAQTNSGYLISGTGYQTVFTSRGGVSPARTVYGGSFLANYSNDGVLKWTCVTKDSNYSGYVIKPRINSVCTDESGNIYIVGYGHESAYFYMPNGDSMRIADCYVPTYYNGFVAKLDSMGVVLWSAVLTNTNPQKIKVDKNGDMVIVGSYFSSGGQWYVNGGTDTPIHTMSSANYFIIRLDSLGGLKWNAPIELLNTNFVDCSDFSLDKNGNLYLTGSYEHTSKFYSPNLTSNVTIQSPGSNYGSKFFLVKYDSLGSPIWSAQDHYTTLGSQGISIVADSLGTTYVTGMHQYSGTNFPITIVSSDTTTTDVNVGGYFTFKFNSFGILQWGVGNQYSYYGYGEGIALSKNEVSVVGILRENSTPFCSTTMTSTSGAAINISISTGDIFIANYDTNGVIKNVLLSGMNPNTYAKEFQKFIFKDAYGMYYITGVTFAHGLSYCGDSITPNGSSDAFVAKFGPNGCAGLIYTSIDNQEVNFNTFSISPNPVLSELLIHSDEIDNYDLNIYNAMGKKVYANKLIGQQDVLIHKNDFARVPGIYFVEALGRKVRYVKKIVVVD